MALRPPRRRTSSREKEWGLPKILDPDIIAGILAKRANGGVTPEGFRPAPAPAAAPAPAEAASPSPAPPVDGAAESGNGGDGTGFVVDASTGLQAGGEGGLTGAGAGAGAGAGGGANNSASGIGPSFVGNTAAASSSSSSGFDPQPPGGKTRRPVGARRPSLRARRADHYIGEGAQNEFFGMWHDFHSGRGIADANRDQERPRSPRSVYLRKCEEKGLVPEPMGVVRKKFGHTISLLGYCMGDEMATAVAESFEMLPWASSLDLRENRLRDAGGTAILRNLGEWVESLDLGHNALGVPSCRALGGALAGRRAGTGTRS